MLCFACYVLCHGISCHVDLCPPKESGTWQKVLERLQLWQTAKRPLRFGELYSGIGLGARVLKHILAKAKEFGVAVDFDYVFAAEGDVDWLRNYGSPTYLLTDTFHFATGHCLDVNDPVNPRPACMDGGLWRYLRVMFASHLAMYRWVPVNNLVVDIIGGSSSNYPRSMESTPRTDNCVGDVEGLFADSWLALLECICRLRPAAILMEHSTNMFYGTNTQPATLMQSYLAGIQYMSTQNMVDSRAALSS